MTLTVAITGSADLDLDHLMLDVNGTITNRGTLLDGIDRRLADLRASLSLHLVSADTFGTLSSVAKQLEARAVKVQSGEEKLRELDRLGRARCVVIGNGTNDALVLEAAALGFVVLGPEGASAAALRAADVVCRSTLEALDLLRDPRALSATVRP